MRISLRWLRDYVEWTLSDGELANRLTMLGFEVESIEHLGEAFEGFVIGEVRTCVKHPNADKLTLCEVFTGTGTLQVVCGALNVKAGQRVVLGTPGAVVPHNQHDPEGQPFTLGRAKVRGVESNGMICSAYELGLGDDRDGILVLPKEALVGTPLATYLGLNDTAFEIGITPNRPDALSHVGIAREVAALLRKTLKIRENGPKESKFPVGKLLSIDIQAKAECPRYTARVIRNINIAPSPRWIQDRLRASGIRPMNNVVDITNFVLMELGQPLHAFDYDRVGGQIISVRLAKPGEKFVTLDGKERSLNAESLLICDAERPIAIAGLMGGMNSEITDHTTTVLLESAYFDPRSIRRTSKHLGLSTDASQRFERGTDPNITAFAIDRAARLINEIAGGEVLQGRLDVYPRKIRPRTISLRVERANAILGTAITRAEMARMLRRIGVKSVSTPTKTTRSTLFEIPTFRPDLEREIDLVEEVARLHGYDKIETKANAGVSFSDQPHPRDIVSEARECLVGSGYCEVITNSLEEKSVAVLTTEKLVEITNPISKDLSVLRPSLLPGLLKTVRHNIFHGTRDLRIFEFGKSYTLGIEQKSPDPTDRFREEKRLAMAFTGTLVPRTWGREDRFYDIFDVKGEITTLLTKILLDKFHFIPYSTSTALTHWGLLIDIAGVEAGLLGEVRKDILQRFEIDQTVFVVDLSVERLEQFSRTKSVYRPVPRYPSVHRDLAFVVGDSVPSETLGNDIAERGGVLLVRVKLFDVYTGNQIPEGTKSCAFTLEFNAEDRTLTQEEVDRQTNGIVEAIGRKYNATLRK